MMPTTFHEYYNNLYEECPTRQLIAGDEVIHKTWVESSGFGKSVYVITSIDLERHKITGAGSIWHPETPITWDIVSNFGETGWLRKVTEQPYDPTQMGDTEDDI